ncbi:MAG TPA: hypothetical protein DIT48_07270 [Actinobacteria bacterium]|nr:hypothetical protein [Actinomycetota bacterium]
MPEILQIPDEARAIILLDHTGTRPGQRENLIAINQRGEILWLAKLPTSSGTDFFGEMELLDEGVSAFSWSCHRVLIDPKTGETMDDRFTK